ncbi:MAG: hypothetical protein U0457_05460 [Candidatus Sericytochromatia bacterium]
MLFINKNDLQSKNINKNDYLFVNDNLNNKLVISTKNDNFYKIPVEKIEKNSINFDNPLKVIINDNEVFILPTSNKELKIVNPNNLNNKLIKSESNLSLNQNLTNFITNSSEVIEKPAIFNFKDNKILFIPDVKKSIANATSNENINFIKNFLNLNLINDLLNISSIKPLEGIKEGIKVSLEGKELEVVNEGGEFNLKGIEGVKLPIKNLNEIKEPVIGKVNNEEGYIFKGSDNKLNFVPKSSIDKTILENFVEPRVNIGKILNNNILSSIKPLEGIKERIKVSLEGNELEVVNEGGEFNLKGIEGVKLPIKNLNEIKEPVIGKVNNEEGYIFKGNDNKLNFVPKSSIDKTILENFVEPRVNIGKILNNNLLDSVKPLEGIKEGIKVSLEGKELEVVNEGGSLI